MIMMEELCLQITKWMEEGDQIILMLDANDDVSNSYTMAHLDAIGLRECILERHYEKSGTDPTHKKGSHPIDGIWVSDSLQIEAGGYLAFGESPSDHRGLWIRVLESVAFGYNMKKVQPPQARRLTLDNPRVVKKWCDTYEAFLLEHQLPQRIFHLQELIALGQWNKQLAKEYEKIRCLRKKGIKLADDKCRKLCMGEVPWSATLQLARTEIELWLNVVSRKKGTKVSTKYITRLENYVGIPHALQITLQQAIDNLKDSYGRYYELKKQATQLRESWLMDLAALKAKELGGNHEEHYKQMAMRERQWTAAHRMRGVLHKFHGNGLSKVSVQTETGEKQELTDKEAIESACLEGNLDKFTQTERTPAMVGQLLADLGFDGDTDMGRQILAGTYTPPLDLDQYSKEYLKELAAPLLRDTPPAIISTQTFREGWTKISEFISSGLSGIHYGHMKACTKSQLLSDFEATICHIPYATGYSPEESRHSLNNMIEKKGKGNLVNDLRTINLLESYFGFNLKVMGRTTSACTEHNLLFPKEQYGSRKLHQAIKHAVNKRLLYDLSHFQRRPMILCSNDAKSCYDRIVHSIASLAMQRLRLKTQPIKCMITSLGNMNHYIQTAFGNSDIYISGSTRTTPFQGILQGNGAGPTLWLAVSTPLLYMMKSAGNGIKYRTPISKEVDSFIGFAFVDDTDIVEGDLRMGHLDIDDVFDKMQDAIDRWEGGLTTTGGAIRPDKLFVYPISYHFKPSGEYEYESVDSMDRTLTVKDHEGIRSQLKLVNAHDGRETLGVRTAPDCNMKDQFKALLKKVRRWTSYVKTGHIPANDAFNSISTTIMKSLEYSAAATTFTQQECNKLVRPIHDATFPHAKICRTLSYDIRYGAKEDLGLGLHDLFTTQGVDKLVFYWEEIKLDSMSGPLLRANLEWALIYLGLGTKSLFDIDYDKYSHLLPNSWIKSLWEFTSLHNIQIPALEYSLLPKRENDIFLMKAFADAGFNKAELLKLNRCRHFLQVDTLADIVDGSGDQLSQRYYLGHKDPYHISTHDWPEQNKPDKKHWKLWRRALNMSFPATQQFGRGKILHRQLGAWVDDISDQWRWFYSPSMSNLFFRSSTYGIWKRYRHGHTYGITRKGYSFKYDTDTRELPSDAVRATVDRNRRSANPNHYRITGWYMVNPNYIPTRYEHDEATLNWTIEETLNDHNMAWLAEQLLLGKNIMVVSDGSFHPDYGAGASSWVITSPSNTDIRVYGDNIIPGNKYVQCAHRIELGGLTGAIRHINNICLQYNITNGFVTLACDGLEAYKAATRHTWRPTTKISHFDLVTTMHSLINSSPIQWKF